jgi:hypothetical protein
MDIFFLFKVDACCTFSLDINSCTIELGRRKKERKELEIIFTFFYYFFVRVRY